MTAKDPTQPENRRQISQLSHENLESIDPDSAIDLDLVIDPDPAINPAPVLDPAPAIDPDALRVELAACQEMIRSLQARNHQLQHVLDSMPQSIFWKDCNSIYQGCNQRFAEVAGVESPEAIVGKNDYDLLWTAQEVESFLEFDRQVIACNQPQLYVIEPPSEVNEQQGWVATSKIPLRDPNGQVIGILGMWEDITERAQEEEALRQSEAQLRQQAQQLRQAFNELKQAQTQLVHAEKMSSLGQLVAGVAHEINNPVGFIHGNLCHAYEHTQALLDLIALYQHHYPEPPVAIQNQIRAIDLDFLQDDLPRLFRSMEVGSERIRQIILSLRSFSRLDESDLKPVDLHEGIDSTLMILQNRLKGNRRHPIQVLKTYTPIPWVECYAGQMNQVFMNLLSNAIDAVEEQSRQMDLTAQPQEWDQGLQESAIVQDSFTLQPPSSGDSEDPTPAHFQPTIWITTQTGEQSVQIHIRDNGIGVSEQVIDQIFNPFFTTKPPGKGTGLGLSISYQIVTEKHHGRLSCVSTVGQGTEFVIELPIQHFDRRALT